jgi:alkylation response protein AidB-like acyl-CoA dehydrogenase
MTTTADELSELAVALRSALGTVDPGAGPTLDPDWRSRWPGLAQLGVTAFCVTEEHGGYGCEVAAALVASRELGAALHGSPFPAISAAAYALARWLEPGPRASVLEPIVAGSEIATVALLEPGAVVAEAGAGVTVDGRARLVPGAPDGDAFLVVAPEGPAMAYVRRGDGCDTSSPDTFDVSRTCADVTFVGAPGLAVRAPAAGAVRTRRLLGLLLAGDALGGVQRMLDRTVAYARDRTAFGRPIGGFQAVQHRLVDHTVRVRGMSLLAAAAAEAMASADPDGSGGSGGPGGSGVDRGALLAEAAVSRHAVPVLHDLLQLTGAIGFTWEYGLHFYERRAHLDARLGRDPRYALGAIAEHEGWRGAGGGNAA